MSNVYLTAFGTFGSQNDFRQTIFLSAKKELGGKTKEFDLNSNAIELFEDSKLFAIKRDSINNNIAISYAIYTYAKEKNSDRRGTFIGSALTFEKEIADENIMISILNNFHQKLVEDNTENQRLKVIHSNDFKVHKPDGFERLSYNTRPIPRLSISNSQTILVYAKTDNNSLQMLFKQALNLLEKYDVILFTADNKVAEFVMRKGMFKILQKEKFDQEVALIDQERKKRIHSLVQEYKNEIQKLNTQREQALSDFQRKIDDNEKKHQEKWSKIK